MKSSYYFCIWGAVALLRGCSPSSSMSDYKATVRDGIKSVPYVREIERIFSNCPTDHFITQFGFDKTQPVLWNTEVFFGGRYVFTYQVFVSIDYTRNRVLKTVGVPKFYLVQVSKVFNDSPETIGADFDADYKFDARDWEKIVAAKGDFSVVGITLDTNHFVPRFDDFVQSLRTNLIQVNE